MSIDVFVSYHTVSSQHIADEVVNKLESNGARCWYASRDVEGDYAESVMNAIESCRVFLLILNKASSESHHVLDEIALASDRASKGKNIRFLVFHIADDKNEIDKTAIYYISRMRWIDAVTPPLTERIDELSSEVSAILGKKAPSSKNSETRRIEYSSGEIYEGEIIDGKRCGKGKLTCKNGDVYDGDWANDQKHGNGKYTWTNGDVYEGDWVLGKMHGKGKLIWSSGNMYDGDWANDQKHGKGKLIWTNGDVYEGDWIDGKREGKGKLTWASGSVYDGEWKDGKREGRGTYTSNGSAYDGDWANDQKHGKGKLIWTNGDVYEGDWIDGKRCGKGKLTCKNGDVYDGDWANDQRHGKGKYIWSSGNMYDGDWVDNKIHGIGKYTWKNGDVYEGGFAEGKCHGMGKLIRKDGKTEEGTWENGVFVGAQSNTDISTDESQNKNDLTSKITHATEKAEMTKPARAYEGDEKYIFISYSHKDSEHVFPIISALQKLGYNVWYDEGIDPGTEWDDNIATHVISSGLMLAFISEHYLASDNCKDELNFAREENIERILIYIENVKLPAGMRMRLGRQQALYYHSYENKRDFYEKLTDAPAMKKVLGAEAN